MTRIDQSAHPLPGPAPTGDDVELIVDGRPLAARAGEPIAMALLAHGIVTCRTTPRAGAPRGLFCGVGRCPDCAMTVDGALNVRTCVTPARPGLRVETQQGLGRWSSAERGARSVEQCGVTGAAAASGEPPRHSAFRAPRSALVVIGGGPAGLAAALGAARAGTRPLLVDEWPALGGRLRHRLAPVGGGAPGAEFAPRLTERVSAAGVEVLTGAVAWGLFAGDAGYTLGVVQTLADDAQLAFQLQAGTVVVATGSTDAARSFPGWTLPGVMLASAVERAILIHRVLPGRRFLVVGDGPEAERAATVIRAGSAEVVATVPLAALRAVHGDVRVTAATIASPDPASAGDDGAGTRELAVDTVCLALGRLPDYALALQLGIDLAYDAARSGYAGQLPARDPNGRTSAPNLYVAGDAAGAVEVEDALLDGARVGLAAAGGDPSAAPALVADLLRA